MAACTLPAEGWLELPLVEKESRATRGRTPSKMAGELRRGDGDIGKLLDARLFDDPQSAMNRTPFSPKRVSSNSITRQLETVRGLRGGL